MKRVFVLILCLVVFLSFTACADGKPTEIEIPDVFGVNYVDAVGILEAEGFEVTAVETSVGNISDKLLYPLERVEKDTVFKVGDYIIDNVGNLNKNYDVFYTGELVSEDKSIVIYYAKEDYVREEEEIPDIAESSSEETSEEVTQENEEETEEEDAEISEESSAEATESSVNEEEASDPPVSEEAADVGDDNTIDPDFKEAMDSYEQFFDEYVEIMKKLEEVPSDISVLADYAKYMGQYAEMMQKFEDWESEDLNTAETAYYIEVQSRITQKLLEVA